MRRTRSSGSWIALLGPSSRFASCSGSPVHPLRRLRLYSGVPRAPHRALRQARLDYLDLVTRRLLTGASEVLQAEVEVLADEIAAAEEEGVEPSHLEALERHRSLC